MVVMLKPERLKVRLAAVAVHFVLSVILNTSIEVDALIPNHAYFYNTFLNILNSNDGIMDTIFFSGEYREMQLYYFLHTCTMYVFGLWGNLFLEIFIHVGIVSCILCLARDSSNGSFLVTYFLFPSFPFSLFFLRDNTILLVLLGLVVLLFQTRIRDWIKLFSSFCLIIAVFFLRFETMFLSLAILGIYLFAWNGKISIRHLVLFVLTCLLAMSVFSEIFYQVFYSYQVYQEITNSSLEGISGLGQYVYSLPLIFRVPAIVFFGLVTIPPYVDILNSLFLSGQIKGIFLMFSYVSMALVILNSIFSRRDIINWYRQKGLYGVLLLTLLYTAVNTVNFLLRRVLRRFVKK